MRFHLVQVFRGILVAIIICSGISGNAQNSEVIDSLKRLCETGTNDTSQVDALLRLCDEYYVYSIDSARKYLDLALDLYDQRVRNHQNAQLKLRDSKLLMSVGALDDATKALKLPDEYFSKHRNLDDLYDLYYQYAAIYYSGAEYDMALEANQQCIDVLHEFADEGNIAWRDDLAKSYHFRSAILINNGFESQAKSYLEKAIQLEISPNIEAAILQVLAYLNISEDDYANAKITLERAIELCDISQDPHACYAAHVEMGKLYVHIEELDSATTHYILAKKYAEQNGSAHYLLGVSQGMSNLEAAKGNYSYASELFHKTNQLHEENPQLLVQDHFYKFWAEVENRIGNYQLAAELFVKHYELTDSTVNEENRAIVADLESKYELSLKENELISSQLATQNAVNQRNLFSGLGVLALLGGLYFWYRNKVNKTISSQKADIKDQRIEQLEKEKKILSMKAMIEGQEAERIRIAKDLHDGLGGLLSTVKAHFSNIQSEIQKVEKLNVYNRANEMMDQACDEVRRISHNLMPGALRLEGLKAAVEHLGEEMQSVHSFKVEVEAVHFDSRMDESREVFIYRIIQEALNNIVKHADANNVLIQLSETSQEHHVIIEDDGRGFDPLTIGSGLGLKSIASRVDFLKGNLDIDTKEGVGTTITIHIPKEVPDIEV